MVALELTEPLLMDSSRSRCRCEAGDGGAAAALHDAASCVVVVVAVVAVAVGAPRWGAAAAAALSTASPPVGLLCDSGARAATLPAPADGRGTSAPASTVRQSVQACGWLQTQTNHTAVDLPTVLSWRGSPAVCRAPAAAAAAADMPLPLCCPGMLGASSKQLRSGVNLATSSRHVSDQSLFTTVWWPGCGGCGGLPLPIVKASPMALWPAHQGQRWQHPATH